MREALAGLTTRGRCFAYAGLACAACGLLLGRHDFIAIGLFLIVLSLGAAASVQRTRYRLTCRRVIDPARVEAGKPGRVVIRLHNVSRLPTGVMLVEDTLPYTLGARPRFVLNRLESQGLRDVAYTLRSDVRGRYLVGPVTMRLTDPLGLCEVAQSFTSTDTLVVTPQIWPLPPLRLGSGAGGSGESRLRAASSSGEDDLGTREYRHGDDLRRIHWRSTARAGELMVRREEQPWQAHALIVLDNREHAHHGDGPGSSFEYACSAAASVGVQLLRNNFTLHLDRGEGSQLVSGPDVDDGLLLDELAIADLERTTTVPGQTSGLRERNAPRAGGVVIAVLGSLTVEDAESVVRAHRSSGQRIAIALETRTWSAAPTHAPRTTHLESEHPDAGARVLSAAGWRVIRVPAGTALADVWNVVSLLPSGPSVPVGSPA
ncbi:DUF58 domain-containing protein [Acidothermaceae bacterium B102]|nr:DUF58 domain-containing protein [Acidothermaceae bacterium B102]